MEIVSLSVEEWRQYRSLRLRALKEDPEAFSSIFEVEASKPDEFWQGRLGDASKGEKSWLLFAREAGKLVGMIGAYIPEGSGDTPTIVSVYVPSEERGKGISRRLMQEMLKTLSSKPDLRKVRLAVNITQIAAVNLYRAFGFQDIGRKPSMTGAGHTVEQLEMERPLPMERD